MCMGTEPRGYQTYHEGAQEPVHMRLHQAAAGSGAVKATEAVWMSWAQQSDGLLDEVILPDLSHHPLVWPVLPCNCKSLLLNVSRSLLVKHKCTAHGADGIECMSWDLHQEAKALLRHQLNARVPGSFNMDDVWTLSDASGPRGHGVMCGGGTPGSGPG